MSDFHQKYLAEREAAQALVPWCCELKCMSYISRIRDCKNCDSDLCVCNCRKYEAYRYCCIDKCMKWPSIQFDGLACRDCMSYSYCKCLCKRHMATIVYCCPEKCNRTRGRHTFGQICVKYKDDAEYLWKLVTARNSK